MSRSTRTLIPALELAAGGGVTSVSLATATGLDMHSTSPRLTKYAGRGLIEKTSGAGQQGDPFRYRITRSGRERIGAGVNFRPLRAVSFGPLLTCWANLTPCGE